MGKKIFYTGTLIGSILMILATIVAIIEAIIVGIGYGDDILVIFLLLLGAGGVAGIYRSAKMLRSIGGSSSDDLSQYCCPNCGSGVRQGGYSWALICTNSSCGQAFSKPK